MITSNNNKKIMETLTGSQYKKTMLSLNMAVTTTENVSKK